MRKIMISRRAITKIQAIIVAAIIIVAAVGGVAYWWYTKPAPGAETIKAGITLPLTGAVSFDGLMAKRGVELAIDWVNAHGGVLGKQVELIIYDDGFEIDKITLLYEKLITEDKVDILLGPLGTYCSVPAGAVASKHDKLLWVSLSGAREPHQHYDYFINPSLTEAPWYQVNIWKPAFEFFDNFEDWDYKNYAKPKKIAFSAMNTPYGVDVQGTLIPMLENAGFEMVINELHEPAITDWTPFISKIKATEPDIIWVLPYFAQSGLFVKQLKEQKGWAPFVIVEAACYNPTAWLDPEEGGVPPEIGNNIMSFQVFPEAYHRDDADWFRAEYESRYGEKYVNCVSAWYIAGMQLAAKAINLADSLEPEKIMETLMNNVFDLVWTRYQAAADGTCVLEYGLNQYSFGQFIDGEWVTIWPPEVAESQPRYPYPLP